VNIEDRIREGLKAAAASVPPATGEPQNRIEGRGRRRRIYARAGLALGGVAAVAAIVGVTIALTTNGGAPDIAAPTTTATAVDSTPDITTPTTTPNSNGPSTTLAPDGELDCAPGEGIWYEQGNIPTDVEGLATPEEAIEQSLLSLQERFGGTIVIGQGDLGSLVLDGLEVATASAEPAPAGGWHVLTRSMCESYRLVRR
jgi:hypothetical protein